MDRQKAIERAYGKHWETVRNDVDEYGWCIGFVEIRDNDFYFENQIGGNCVWRPNTLIGIENNNRWTKIETESDLPKGAGDFHVVLSNGEISSVLYNLPDLIAAYKTGVITHYKPAEKHKKPHY